jgi:hypothetical protein
LGTNTFAQNYEIKVREENEKFTHGSQNALTVTIYENESDAIDKEFKSLMKDFGYDKQNADGNHHFYDNVKFKDLGNNPVDVYTRLDKGKDDKTVKLSVAFDLGGAHMSSSQHKDKYEYFKKMMHEFATKLTKEAVNEQLKAANKVLSDLESKQSSLEKDNKGLEDDIKDYNDKIKKAQDDIAKNKTDIETKKKEIETQKKVTDVLKQKYDSVK